VRLADCAPLADRSKDRDHESGPRLVASKPFHIQSHGPANGPLELDLLNRQFSVSRDDARSASMSQSSAHAECERPEVTTARGAANQTETGFLSDSHDSENSTSKIAE
jgi:hypothetical protein